MTNRTSLRRISRSSVLLAVVALMVVVLPVSAASSVHIEARPLVGGRYQVNGWLALSVSLANDGAPTQGYLQVETESGTVQRFVEMPAGARKAASLYVRPEPFQRQVTVKYVEPNGTVESVAQIRVLEEAGDQIAIVGDTTATLRPQIIPDEGSFAEPLPLGIGDIPERPEPLAGISSMVWAADATGLSEEQRRGIERWVADGGQLVVIGGADWQARASAFADLLPLDELRATDGVPQAALAAWSGADEPAISTATVSSGALRDDARALVTADDGTILVSMRDVGAGRVILIGSDMATDEYRGWEGSPALWGRLLPSNAAFEQFFGGMPPDQEAESMMSQALGNLPSLEVPPAELLLAVIVAYILLIGPISYVVLRRRDRREMAWITAPVLVILFAGTSYGLGSAMKGGDVIVNQISLIRSSGAGSTATVQAYTGIFSPNRTTYDLSVEADALVAQLQPQMGPNGQTRGSPGTVIEQGNPATVRDLAIGVFGFEGIRADAVVEHEPALSVTWRTLGDDLVGTVTNISEVPMEDVAYVSNSQGEMVGDLEPGESAEFEIGSLNFNGSSASDQVYGFGGFDMADAAQRAIMVRRNVIDALVGYPQFMEMGQLTSMGRGPYVIGWRSDAGPLPVAVVDLTAQRYNSSVEVVSVRPSLRSGKVTIGPTQMSVSVLATEGDVTSQGPGMLMIGEGSAIYGISLPLEAAGMRIESATLIVGIDPSMVLDQGGFPGAWPPGTTVELRDPASGEWRQLGDLNDENRFEIDDPAAAMGDTGRLEVRITGVGANANFGQNSVFVSAEVEGVIDE
jgi:hypothetical protein